MTADPNADIPDLPRSEFERAIDELVGKAHHVLELQRRLRQLLAATRSVGDGLDLQSVLRRITEAAVELVGARYGALGVNGPDGGLEQFIHVGLDTETAARIGELPRGRGVLGAVIADPRPLRLEHLSDDPRAHGFPPHHPPMDSFAGVPIRIRDEVFGNLYLTDRAGGPFSAEDEELLTALAASAAVAIDNARLFGQAQRRQRWAIASAETGAALLSDETVDPLAVVAETVARLTDAAAVSLHAPSPGGGVRVEGAWGEDAAAFRGRVYAAGASTSETVIESGNPRLSSGAQRPDSPRDGALTGPVMSLPIARPDGERAALVITRPTGAPRFVDGDLDMAMEFASHAGVALQLREARRVQERVTLLEDRSRIARDLHDNVIQRLFGAGLALNALDPHRIPSDVAAKVETVTGLLDEAIAEIRTSVFALRSTARERPPARYRLLDVVGDAAGAFPTPPRVLFEGDLDALAPDAVLDDLEAVVREGLANAARHAAATAVQVSVSAADDEIRVTVSDDGRGPGPAERSSGLANLAARAQAWGGDSALTPGADGGAVLAWWVPVPGVDA